MLHNEERRPLGKADGAEENFTLAPSLLGVRGHLRVDLRRLDDVAAGQRVRYAAHSPVGATIEFVVAARQLPSWDAIAYFRDTADRLEVIVVSDDVGAIRRWTRAFRDGVRV